MSTVRYVRTVPLHFGEYGVLQYGKYDAIHSREFGAICTKLSVVIRYRQ